MNTSSSPLGLHRVIEPPGVLPQAAWRLDASPAIAPDEVRIRVDRLNLDAASYRQLREAYSADPDKIRQAVLDIITTRGKMQNPVTGSGGMLTGTVDEVGPASPLGLTPGQRIATLVSLTLTPLQITDGLAAWDGQSEQVPCEGHAILFARSIAAVLPDDLPAELSLAVMDVCGAPALTSRVVTKRTDVTKGRRWRGLWCWLWVLQGRAAPCPRQRPARPAPARSSAWSLRRQKPPCCATPATTKDGGAEGIPRGVRPRRAGPSPAPESPLVDAVVIADARDPVGLAEKVEAAGGPADVTVVCVDVAGCEGGAILSTKQGGTVIFFSMATSFSAAALGAEGLAADVTMLVGNGYVPGHADLALDLIRTTLSVRRLFEMRVGA